MLSTVVRRFVVKKAHVTTLQFEENAAPIEGLRVGRVVGINESGLVLVDFTGNSLGPIAARTTSTSNAKLLGTNKPKGREVLLAFDNNDPRYPIIVDTMYSLIEEITEPADTTLEVEKQQEATIDGKRLSFDAENEIVLSCGKASITLTKAGKVLIKGDYVLSHSSGENRIRGGSISIN